MRGEVQINFVEKPYRAVNNNYRNIICLIAPFKDDSFVFKSYNTLEDAVTGEKTTNASATGYAYLQLLYKYFPNIDEIVLGNLTTNTATSGDPVLDYTLTNAKLGAVLEELDEVGVSFIVVPAELSIAQFPVYKAFYDEQRAKMNAFGLISPVTPTATSTTDFTGATITAANKLTLLDTYFKDGGFWEKITTPIKIVDEEDDFSLAETTVYLAGLTATLNENISLTHYVLDNVEGNTSAEEYTKAVFDLINQSGAIALNYRDKIHKVVQVYNSGTSTVNEKLGDTLDLKIERVHALIINEFRISLLNAMGHDNSKITYDNFESIARAIRDKYMIEGFISGLDWSVDKTGSATILVPIQEQQNNIISTIDVTGVLIVS
jgi:hypothetical protein